MVLQSEASECGLACLAAVMQLHGHQTSLHELRQQFPTSLKGVTLQQLVQQASVVGFSARPLRLELEQLGQLRLPCILHWGLDHFVVLTKVHRRGATLHDPAVGQRRVSAQELSRSFTGVALELTPNASFAARRAGPKLSLEQLTGKVHGLAWSLAQIGAVALALELFAIVGPLLNQLVIDEAVGARDADLLNVLVLGFGLLLVTQIALGMCRGWMVLILGQTLSLQWAGNLLAHLVRLPIDWFERRHLGDIASRFQSVNAIRQTITTALIEALLDGLMVVAALGLMWMYSPLLTGIVAAAVAAYALVQAASYRLGRSIASERIALAAREQTHFLETLRAMTPIRLFGREDDRRSRWQHIVVEVQNRDVRAGRLNIMLGSANGLIFGIENLAVLWVGARLIMGDSPGEATRSAAAPFTVGMLFAFLSYKAQFTGRMSALIGYAVQLRMLGLHLERMADIALAAPERDSPQGDRPTHDLTHLAPSLELRGVGFRYGNGDPWVLRNANLSIAAGERVAITGASGAGKTTLVKVLLGLLKPTVGEVLYGGHPIGHLGKANVRRRIATVMQEDALLSGSLLDNITFFDPQPDAARAEGAARRACIHNDIVAMPMGYLTRVGDLGSGLSGGQKQRLLLARALYREPAVLVLDEATSHLDLANERLVSAALADLQLTLVVIAHRQETVALAQRVLLVKDGRVVEVRSPDAGAAHGQVGAGRPSTRADAQTRGASMN